MAKKKQKNVNVNLVDVIVHGMLEKKANHITIINLTKLPNAVCDYFIICDGVSNTQVGAIAESVVREVKTTIKINPSHKEGYQNSEWILLDYFDVVVHIFQEQSREFYRLEDLWADAEIKQIVSPR